MYFILVTIENKMFPMRQFADNGAGPEAVIQEAMEQFQIECEAAQHTANGIKRAVTVELINQDTGNPIVFSTLKPIDNPR